VTGWFSSDPLDAEIIERLFKKDIRDGEEKLMLTVLESAVEDFQKYVLTRNPQWKEAISTSAGPLLEKDNEELFAFENICETLGLHPDHIRKGLMVWKEARIKMSSLQAHPASRPQLANSRIEQAPIVARQRGYQARTYD
jgi:hypothetical protein